MGSNDHLPHELCREILSILPVKSIIRFRSVCKSWYSLVSCPNFISDYSTRNLNKNGKRILLQPYDPYSNLRPFSSDVGSFMEFHEHDEVPEAFLGYPSNARIVGSCNGLICLSKRQCYGDTRFLIWNPTIRKVVELPSIPYCPNILDPYFGFGFDFKTGDFKVMCTHLGRKNRDASVSDAIVCEIFDLSKGAWRVISPLVRSWNVRGFAPECYLNGAVHWTGSRQVRSSDRILLSFDMSDEIFREIRMPDWNGRGLTTRSVAFEGLIHVIMWKMDCHGHVLYRYGGCSVWAMKEYGVAESWTKLFNIQLSSQVYESIDPSKFHLWEGGGVLMVHDFSNYKSDDEEHINLEYNQELLLYNIESRKCKQLSSRTESIQDICLFEESLVLM